MVQINRTRPRILSLRRRLPRWFNRLINAGIVTTDDLVRRRQIMVNIGSMMAIAAALAHGAYNALYAFWPLLPINIYNLALIVVFAAVHRMHKYGETAGAVLAVMTIMIGNLYVIWAFGIEGGGHTYYTIAAATFVFFGPRHWRLFALFLAMAYCVILVVFLVVPQAGPVLADDPGFRRSFAMQVTVNVLTVNSLLFVYTIWALSATEQALSSEYAKSEHLIGALLPPRIAEQLKIQPDRRIADRHPQMTVLIVDMSSLLSTESETAPEAALDYLDSVHSAFDRATGRYGLETIKTAGDRYMAVGGFGDDPRRDAIAAGGLVLDMMEEVARRPRPGGDPVSLRAGMHVGPAIAGVIGRNRITFNVWGAAARGAFAMLAVTPAGTVRVTGAYRDLVGDTFRFEPGEAVEVENVGRTETAQLVGFGGTEGV